MGGNIPFRAAGRAIAWGRRRRLWCFLVPIHDWPMSYSIRCVEWIRSRIETQGTGVEVAALPGRQPCWMLRARQQRHGWRCKVLALLKDGIVGNPHPSGADWLI